MAFQTDGLAKIYSEIQTRMIRLDNEATEFAATIANLGGGSLSANAITSVFTRLGSYADFFSTAASTPGLAAYAQDQQSDPAYDIAAEFTAVQNAIDNALTWINDNFPKDPTNTYILKDELNLVDKAVITRTFTQAQLSGLQTQLEAIAAAIE